MSSTVRFADVAHQTLLFDRDNPTAQIILELIETRWVQRLRRLKQTGNTNLVYMFAEHSRFGHSLGVAYLAYTLLEHLKKYHREQVEPFALAVAAAALLHDIGHVAPGSHLGEHIWYSPHGLNHEFVGSQIIEQDEELLKILSSYDSGLVGLVSAILTEEDSVPAWAKSVISGDGWNADRGNWAIVDSAMCSVSYGRYNVEALIDAMRLSSDGQLVITENRLDALTHFFVARDSMYRQVYQHRVLQAADALTCSLVARLRDLMPSRLCGETDFFLDDVMLSALDPQSWNGPLDLGTIFKMNDHWWAYHIERWVSADDPIVRDLSARVRDRRLFKTIRLQPCSGDPMLSPENAALISDTQNRLRELGYDPRYYLCVMSRSDLHRRSSEKPPLVLLENGQIVPVTQVEPLVRDLLKPPDYKKLWLAVPREVKERGQRSCQPLQ